MGLDYNSLKDYGGFDGLLERLKSRNKGDFMGTAEEDFGRALYDVLAIGIDPAETELGHRKPNDTVLNEFEAGVKKLSRRERKEIAEILKRIFA